MGAQAGGPSAVSTIPQRGCRLQKVTKCLLCSVAGYQSRRSGGSDACAWAAAVHDRRFVGRQCVLFISLPSDKIGDAAGQRVGAAQRARVDSGLGAGRQSDPAPAPAAPAPAMALLSSEALLLSTSDLAAVDCPCRLLAASTENLAALKSVCTALPRLLATPRCPPPPAVSPPAASPPGSLGAAPARTSLSGFCCAFLISYITFWTPG